MVKITVRTKTHLINLKNKTLCISCSIIPIQGKITTTKYATPISLFLELQMHNDMTNEVTLIKHVQKNLLFGYLLTCGNGTGNPPTTPGGMTVCPVSTGTTLSILVAPSKLRATIFYIPSPQYNLETPYRTMPWKFS